MAWKAAEWKAQMKYDHPGKLHAPQHKDGYA